MSENRAYGAACDWANRLPESFPIVSTDFDSVPLAFREAAKRRRAGEPFAAAAFIFDPRTQFAQIAAAPPIIMQQRDLDQRTTLLDALAKQALVINGKDQKSAELHDSRLLKTTFEFLSSADLVVFRSSVERGRMFGYMNRPFRNTAIIAPLDPRVPQPSEGSRIASTIVVWAPHLPAEACGIFGVALEEFKRPAVIVCAAGNKPALRDGTLFVGIADAAAALAEAAAIIDASFYDPGVARALANWGVPMAVASTSGANEYLDGVSIYAPWDHRSILASISTALSGRAPRVRPQIDELRELQVALDAAIPPVPENGPLVSIVVPTRNREVSLVAALESIERQTYSNYETIVVNDGGAPLGDSLARFPKLRVIEFAQNEGVSAAVNAGIATSRGKYIALLADDDVYCPDHLARLVEPLERTGGHVIHSLELGEHYDRRPDGTLAPIGHSIIAGEPAYPSKLLVVNVIGGPSIMFSRAAYDRAGPFDARAGHLMDLEMWMRLGRHFEFTHLPHPTAIMSMRTDASQASALTGRQTSQLYRTIYDLNPTDRRLVEQGRTQHVEAVAAIEQIRTLPTVRTG